MTNNDQKVFVVSAPSGAGKTTLNRMLTEKYPSIEIAVSLTTRKQRKGETAGKDYHYVTQPEFRKAVEQGLMLEWANVHGNLYGTGKEEIDRILAVKHFPLLEIDVQGWQSTRQVLKRAVAVFLFPPDIESLWHRLEMRGTDSEEVRWHRLMKAKEEIAASTSYHYFIVNDDRNRAFAELEGILMHGRMPLLNTADAMKFKDSLLMQYNEIPWLLALEKKYGVRP